MTDPQYKFYECENSNCGLRYPGYDGFPRWNRCPVCRANTHVIALTENADKNIDRSNILEKRQVEALLDNIRSAWNVGSIFRTADGTGIHKLYLCGISPTPENPKVNKTALGAEANILWEKSSNGVKTAKFLKSQGAVLWALEDLPVADPLFQVEIPANNSPLVLIVGNEVCGVDPGIIEICDKVIFIPMLGKKNSYNVAIAFSIAASFLLYRQTVSQESRNIFPST